MNVLDIIKRRYSVRSYSNKKVEEEKLKIVLEAARLAPSARNMQEWRFIVVDDKNLKQELSIASNNQTFVSEAPIVIVCCSIINDYVMRCGQLAYPIDLAIAIDHMTLQAEALELGTCWIGAFYPEKVRPILNIPESIPVVELLTLGYPKSKEIPNKNRLPLDKIYSKNKWEDIKT